MRAGYLVSLRFPAQQMWADDDIVYFSEDDYLHLEQAFVALRSASDQIPSAAYFALYARPRETPASVPEYRTPCPRTGFIDPRDWSTVTAG